MSRLSIVCVLLFGFVAGIEPKAVKSTFVKGIVTCHGKPADDAMITLVNDNASKKTVMGFARVDSSGRYAFGGHSSDSEGNVRLVIDYSCDSRPTCSPSAWTEVPTSHICPEDSCLKDSENSYDVGEISVDSPFKNAPEEDGCKEIDSYV